MNAYEKIGKRLQKAREEAGLSQEELAKQLGCSQAALSYYELGKRRLYFAELEKISTILNRPLAYFLENSELNEAPRNELHDLLKEPDLKEILRQAGKLNQQQRKAVLEFMEWQKFKDGGTS